MIGRLLIAGALWVLPLAACNPFDAQVCTAHIEPGIRVTIVDSVSGEPRAAEAMAVARDGAFADTLDPAVSRSNVLLSRQGAYERAGFYEVTVRAPGYVDWIRRSVRVRPGDCHVQRVELEARLQAPTP